MGKDPELTKMVCVRLEPDLVDDMQEIADRDERTLSQHIRRVLKADTAKRKGSGKSE